MRPYFRGERSASTDLQRRERVYVAITRTKRVLVVSKFEGEPAGKPRRWSGPGPFEGPSRNAEGGNNAVGTKIPEYPEGEKSNIRSTISGVAFCISARALDHDRAIHSPHLNPRPYKMGNIRTDHVSALWLDYAVRVRDVLAHGSIEPTVRCLGTA